MNQKTKETGRGCLVLIVLVVVLFFALRSCLDGDVEVANPQVSLQADGLTMWLTNNDTVDFNRVKVEVNGVYKSELKSLARGERKQINLVDQVTKDGTRFKPFEQKVVEAVFVLYYPDGSFGVKVFTFD